MNYLPSQLKIFINSLSDTNKEEKKLKNIIENIIISRVEEDKKDPKGIKKLIDIIIYDIVNNINIQIEDGNIKDLEIIKNIENPYNIDTDKYIKQNTNIIEIKNKEKIRVPPYQKHIELPKKNEKILKEQLIEYNKQNEIIKEDYLKSERTDYEYYAQFPYDTYQRYINKKLNNIYLPDGWAHSNVLSYPKLYNVYYNRDLKQVVWTIRGTDFLRWSDYLSVFKIMFMGNSIYQSTTLTIPEEINYFEVLLNIFNYPLFKNYKIIFSSHSAGASIQQGLINSIFMFDNEENCEIVKPHLGKSYFFNMGTSFVDIVLSKLISSKIVKGQENRQRLKEINNIYLIEGDPISLLSSYKNIELCTIHEIEQKLPEKFGFEDEHNLNNFLSYKFIATHRLIETSQDDFNKFSNEYNNIISTSNIDIMAPLTKEQKKALKEKEKEETKALKGLKTKKEILKEIQRVELKAEDLFPQGLESQSRSRSQTNPKIFEVKGTQNDMLLNSKINTDILNTNIYNKPVIKRKIPPPPTTPAPSFFDQPVIKRKIPPPPTTPVPSFFDQATIEGQFIPTTPNPPIREYLKANTSVSTIENKANTEFNKYTKIKRAPIMKEQYANENLLSLSKVKKIGETKSKKSLTKEKINLPQSDGSRSQVFFKPISGNIPNIKQSNKKEIILKPNNKPAFTKLTKATKTYKL